LAGPAAALRHRRGGVSDIFLRMMENRLREGSASRW